MSRIEATHFAEMPLSMFVVRSLSSTPSAVRLVAPPTFTAPSGGGTPTDQEAMTFQF